MINVNKNSALTQLKEMVSMNLNRKLDYMPEAFNKEQENALRMFQQRIFLEEVIDESISFNKKMNFESGDKNIYLTNTAEELIEVYQLRSDVYTEIGYQDEFPDTIEGLNFDKYDKNSAILYYKNNNTITGTTRLIYDSKEKLPSEAKFSFDGMRAKYNTIGELSRLIVKNESKGLSLEFKYLMQGIHNLFLNNEIDITLLGIKKEHYKLYTKFGGSEIIKELDKYGEIDLPFLILSWNPSEASRFFKKAFLS